HRLETRYRLGKPGSALNAVSGFPISFDPRHAPSSPPPPRFSINGNDAGHSIIIENDFIADVLYTLFLLSLSSMDPMARLLNKFEGRSYYLGTWYLLHVKCDKSLQGFRRG
ncbi:MAG: hypothetical protein NTZ35_05050, partial [Ignavibacteriales bacterium]|nr:hypothetical protein [Ignavibacteriales bacterium]